MIKLYYQEKGKGEAFVLLHGNNSSSEYFKKQIEYFSSKYRVIAVDTRGHGKSPRGEKPFNMNQFSEDLNNLLNELKLDKVILLGFSDGANIAMKYALKYQERIKKLILVGGNIEKKGLKFNFIFPVEIGYIVSKFFPKKVKKSREMLGLMIYNPNIKPKELNIIKVPTLVMAGTNDIVKESHTKIIAKNIPNSKLVIIEGNHFILSRKSEIANKEIEKFLKGGQHE